MIKQGQYLILVNFSSSGKRKHLIIVELSFLSSKDCTLLKGINTCALVMPLIAI